MADRRQPGFGWLVPILLAIVSLVVSSWVAYSRDKESATVKIAVTSAKQEEDHARLERLEKKVDAILDILRSRP